MTQRSYSERLAQWFSALSYDDIPVPVRADAKLRVLDILGTTLAASTLESSRIVRDGALAANPGEECRILGFGDVPPPRARHSPTARWRTRWTTTTRIWVPSFTFPHRWSRPP